MSKLFLIAPNVLGSPYSAVLAEYSFNEPTEPFGHTHPLINTINSREYFKEMCKYALLIFVSGTEAPYGMLSHILQNQ